MLTLLLLSSGGSSGGRRFATLGDLGSSGAPPSGPARGHGGHGHAPGDDEDDDEDDRPGDRGENWYAGGERRYASCLHPFGGRGVAADARIIPPSYAQWYLRAEPGPCWVCPWRKSGPRSAEEGSRVRFRVPGSIQESYAAFVL